MTREEIVIGIDRERNVLKRKLAEIRRWLGGSPEAAEGIEELCARFRTQMDGLPAERRRLLQTTASLAIADLRNSEDALRRYLEIVEGELKRRGAHAAASGAYGQHAPQARRFRRV
jgi:hypothetical protein